MTSVRGGGDEYSRFVVCGAGAGGLAMAARLGRKFGEGNVIVVDPADVNKGIVVYADYINVSCITRTHAPTS